MPMDIKEKLNQINTELAGLEIEKQEILKLRQANEDLLKAQVALAKAKVGNALAKATTNPVVTLGAQEVVKAPDTIVSAGKEVGGALKEVYNAFAPDVKKVAGFFAQNMARAKSNQALASTLKPGQSAFNQVTGQTVTKNPDGTYIASKRQIVKV